MCVSALSSLPQRGVLRLASLLKQYNNSLSGDRIKPICTVCSDIYCPKTRQTEPAWRGLYPLCAFYLLVLCYGQLCKKERDDGGSGAATPPLRPLSLLAKEEDKWAYQITWCCEWVCAKNVLLKKERACLFVGIEITMRNASRHTQHTHKTPSAQSCGEDYFHRRRGNGENACLNRWRWVQEWKVLCWGWFLRSSRR